jgi:molybdopterin-containing oxidoreductase family iron-sulfur binding subunit
MDMNRRTFLKAFGAGAGAGLLPACTDAPVQHVYAYLTPPEEIVPGEAAFYASVCRDCPAGCGLSVRTREARPVKLEGNPECPVSRGALCARGQSTLQAAYDPDRLQVPRLGAPGALRVATPAEAVDFLGTRLAEARRAGKRIVLLTGVQTGTGELLHRMWADRLGARCLPWEPIQWSALKAACAHLYGRPEVPRFGLAEADFILNLGAELVEGWLSPVELSRELAQAHAWALGARASHVAVSPRRDLTAAAADHWLSVRPGCQGLIALGLARAVLEHGPRPALAEDERARLAAWLEPYPLALVSRRAGCDQARLTHLAGRLARAGAALALPPGEHLYGPRPAFEAAAVMLLNHVLGAVGTRVRFGAELPWTRLAPARELADLWQAAGRGEVGALLLAGRNPVHEWPDTQAVQAALRAIPSVIQLAERPDETSAFAHAELPASHFLEGWGDYQPRADWLGLQQPVMRPRGEQRQVEDWLLALAGAAGAALPWTDFRQCLAQRWAWLQKVIAPEADAGSFFRTALARGGVDVPQGAALAGLTPASEPGEGGPSPDPAAGPPTGSPLVLVARGLPEAPEEAAPGGDPQLLAYPSGRLYDGRTANRPWLQELPDPLTQTLWDTPAELAPSLAARLGVQSGDRLELRAGPRTLQATARVMPGAREDVVAVPLGGGRQESGLTASGRGARVLELMTVRLDPLGGGLVLLGAGVSPRRLEAGALTTVEGSPYTHGRPIVPDVTRAELEAGRVPVPTLHGTVQVDVRTGRPLASGHDHRPVRLPEKHLRKAGERSPGEFYPAHDFPEHAWGLAIDLDRCTGCGACVVACQAENNIPTVGPEMIRQGREMHWIRLERYWVEGRGDALDGPAPRFLPVMCQHCENAPCEPVCPVFAAYHTRDGLNAQIYNRCIGTRYCSNNCPYKVRRFNWFDHRWPEPLGEQLNPDVTVRSAGVMEKCTLCIQRIRAGLHRARLEGRELQPGDIVPACAQTCPSGAITFGDRKREDSEVSRLIRDARSYRLLDYFLNTRPAIAYLYKVERSEVPAEPAREG